MAVYNSEKKQQGFGIDVAALLLSFGIRVAFKPRLTVTGDCFDVGLDKKYKYGIEYIKNKMRPQWQKPTKEEKEAIQTTNQLIILDRCETWDHIEETELLLLETLKCICDFKSHFPKGVEPWK